VCVCVCVCVSSPFPHGSASFPPLARPPAGLPPPSLARVAALPSHGVPVPAAPLPRATRQSPTASLWWWHANNRRHHQRHVAYQCCERRPQAVPNKKIWHRKRVQHTCGRMLGFGKLRHACRRFYCFALGHMYFVQIFSILSTLVDKTHGEMFSICEVDEVHHSDRQAGSPREIQRIEI
jgi:hypothetical protein